MGPALILKLRALRADLDKILLDLEEPLMIVPAGSVPPAYQSQAQVPAKASPTPATHSGLLPNPYVGIIDNVTWKEIPTSRGPSKLYELHAAGVRISTFKEKDANDARAAKEQGQPVSIVWKPRTSANGKYTNYDLVSLTIPKRMVN